MKKSKSKEQSSGMLIIRQPETGIEFHRGNPAHSGSVFLDQHEGKVQFLIDDKTSFCCDNSPGAIVTFGENQEIVSIKIRKDLLGKIEPI